jgi:hypothetical protein
MADPDTLPDNYGALDDQGIHMQYELGKLFSFCIVGSLTLNIIGEVNTSVLREDASSDHGTDAIVSQFLTCSFGRSIDLVAAW